MFEDDGMMLTDGSESSGASSLRMEPLVALLLSGMLLLTDVAHVARYTSMVLDFHRGEKTGVWKSVAPRRLEAQVRYLTMRFGTHARRWQLVLWLRQLTLFAISVALDVLTNQLHSEGKGDADVDPYRYVFAGLCIVTLLGFWLWHHRKQPCDRAAAQTL